MEYLHDWETMTMLAPDYVDNVRSDQKRVFVPPRIELDPSCSRLQRSAMVLAGPHYDDSSLPHQLTAHLAAYFGLRMEDFEVSQVHRAYGDYIAIFPTETLRDRAVQVGIFNLGAGVDVQLTEWTSEMSMIDDSTSHLARLRLHGVPLQNWNEDDLDIILAEVGHVVKVAPLFDSGNYRYIRVLVACHQPVNIPKTLLMITCPHAALITVKLEGWIRAVVEPYPPEIAHAIWNQRNHEGNRDDRHRPAPPHQPNHGAQQPRAGHTHGHTRPGFGRPHQIWARKSAPLQPTVSATAFADRHAQNCGKTTNESTGNLVPRARNENKQVTKLIICFF